MYINVSRETLIYYLLFCKLKTAIVFLYLLNNIKKIGIKTLLY